MKILRYFHNNSAEAYVFVAIIEGRHVNVCMCAYVRAVDIRVPSYGIDALCE